jgi:tetratricopeptide (TPR) repeat protein
VSKCAIRLDTYLLKYEEKQILDAPFIARKKGMNTLLKNPYIRLFVAGLLTVSSTGSYPADGTSAFAEGQRFYAEAQFTAARAAFEQAVRCQPAVSKYHHWLGRTYGRLAERASWFEAMRLAEQTREALEHAVKLDPNNVEALSDLREYYLQAPAFLGGGQVKADRIRQQLEDVLSDSARTP